MQGSVHVRIRSDGVNVEYRKRSMLKFLRLVLLLKTLQRHAKLQSSEGSEMCCVRLLLKHHKTHV